VISPHAFVMRGYPLSDNLFDYHYYKGDKITMKKSNTLKKGPSCQIVEEERLNTIIDKLVFDLELSNRKNCLLENTRKQYISANDRQYTIVSQARREVARDAIKRARETREKLANDKAVAFDLLINSGVACMPFKNLDMLNRFKMSDGCEECSVIDFCRTCRKAIRTIGRPLNGQRASTVDNIPIIKCFTPGKATYTFLSKVYEIPFTNWADYKQNLKRAMPRKDVLAQGMKPGQYSGLQHFSTLKGKLNLSSQ